MAIKTLAISAVVATLATATAQAQLAPAVPFATTTKWTIAMDPNQGRGCFMEGNYQGTDAGTTLRIGHNALNAYWYATVRNPSWTSFRNGETLTVTVSLNNLAPTPWTGTVTQLSDGSLALYFPGLNQGVTGSIAAASLIEIRYNGSVVLHGQLTDSSAGVQQLQACEITYGVQRPADPFRPTAPAVRVDPFTTAAR